MSASTTSASLAWGGDDQDGDAALDFVARGPDDLEAAHVRQRPFEDQQIVALPPERLEQVLPLGVDVAFVTQAQNGLVDQLALIRRVIEHCNTHSIPFFTVSLVRCQPKEVYLSASMAEVRTKQLIHKTATFLVEKALVRNK
ncbi:hypothetical protein M2165_002318 [Variovorax sp. TBS-050B]|nr:hypothetical protein [Variovorax sp. TBS-050B]